jgi:putative ABC transport system permease protein
MVEAQRRELGVGMALGAARWQLALRPVLVGVEIAVASVVLGIGVGALAVALIRPVFLEMLPLPVWITDFQWVPFSQGAALGFVIPIAATVWPVWRAVRMTPVEAITTVHRQARRGWSSLLRRLPWPRRAFRRMPLGNVLRTPRRTLLTALGLGATIATLVSILGMIDSFAVSMSRNETEVLGDHPDRVVVTLDGLFTYAPAGGASDGASGNASPEVDAVRAAAGVGAVAPVLRLAGRLSSPGSGTGAGSGSGTATGFDVVVDVIDLDGDVWRPTLVGNGADDLGVGVGDTVALTHPARVGDGFVIVTTELSVIGIEPSPFRFNAYLDRRVLAGFGAAGLVNELWVLPAPGFTTEDVERALFDLPGVASVLPAAAASQVISDSLDEFTSIFAVAEAFMLALALVMAYNTTSINADERARERATLFAFGLPVHRVLILEVVEGLLYGTLGTIVGLGLGAWLTQWMVTSVWSDTMPELSLDVVIATSTVLTAVALGVIAVAVAPILTLRRLRRMDVPGTLRVVE